MWGVHVSVVHPEAKEQFHAFCRSISSATWWRSRRRTLALGSAGTAGAGFLFVRPVDWILDPIYMLCIAAFGFDVNTATMIAFGVMSWATVVGAMVWFLASLPDIVRRLHGDSLRRHKYAPGHCQTCGYDLTGNTSGVCPECGTKVESP